MISSFWVWPRLDPEDHFIELERVGSHPWEDIELQKSCTLEKGFSDLVQE